MFLKVNDSILSRKDLKSSDKLILSLISSFEACQSPFFMSNEQIALALGMTKRQVINVIQKLEQMNLIKCLYTKSQGIRSNRTITICKSSPTPCPTRITELFEQVYNKIK